jgi:hypothetical protein
MAIPDHVRKQAMDAVSNKVTTAQIRLYCSNDQPAIFNPSEKAAPGPRASIPDDVRKQAMDAIADKGTMAQLRLIESKGSVSPIGTPSPGKNLLAEKVAKMHAMGHGIDSTHQQMTKDGFGRECA